jgi:hypothetical protein
MTRTDESHRVDSIREVERLPLRLYRGYCTCGHFTRRTLIGNKAHKLIMKHIGSEQR